MQDTAVRSMAARVLIDHITIPVAASPVTILSLVSALLADNGIPSAYSSVGGVNIIGMKTDGTVRAALLAGHETAKMYRYIDIGMDYVPPVRDIERLYISTTAAATEQATIEVYIK